MKAIAVLAAASDRCIPPTKFRSKMIITRHATTIAGEGRRKSFLMSYPFLEACTARLPPRSADARRRSDLLRFPYRDQHRLVILARSAARSAIDMALKPVDKPKPAPLQDRWIQIATIVDDHDHRRLRLE